MRAIKLFSLLCLAAMSAFVLRAQTVSTGGAAGTYTYTINLGNGASFDMTLDGAFGTPGSNVISYSFDGTPVSGYTNDQFIATSGGSTYYYNGDGTQVYDGGFDQEVVLQYDSNATGYSNILDYTFVEPTSFWEDVGTQSFAIDDGEYIDALEGWTGYDTAGQFDGEVAEGANYNYYGGGTDPACSTCTITTTFVAAPAATPEPSSLALLATGLLGGVAAFRRRFV